MPTYTVTGIIQVCLHSRWMEGGIRVEVEAENRDAAITAALAMHKAAAERRDKHATVRWHTPELVRTERVTALEWQA